MFGKSRKIYIFVKHITVTPGTGTRLNLRVQMSRTLPEIQPPSEYYNLEVKNIMFYSMAFVCPRIHMMPNR